MSFPGPDQVAGWGAAQQPSAQPPQARSKAPVVVLAVLAALFAIAAGVFTVFYFGEKAESDRVAAAVADKEREVAAAKDGLGDAEEQARAALDELESQEGKLSSLETEKDEVAACTAAAKRYVDAPEDLPEPELDKLFDTMYEACRYI
ncbi:hypothetical protein [Actinokineospora fastidiosa]|uniref:Uncharacterized protein n=1 Tax=Actinokineospora fastidiosa TaxID=1816 RepID=A0A918GP52_9PSEU|nr:hypothetical protein [Actinokineospora fastidiosa]GGS51784.1 hypothetical protein GCM10010171_53550 [Actinokineospora fastidiosa]